jgi:hypothetical protein
VVPVWGDWVPFGVLICHHKSKIDGGVGMRGGWGG